MVSYKGIKQVNDHGEVNIEGIIPFNMLERYLNIAKKVKIIARVVSETNV